VGFYLTELMAGTAAGASSARPPTSHSQSIRMAGLAGRKPHRGPTDNRILSSKYRDQTECYYYGHRYYLAATGSWLSRDPWGGTLPGDTYEAFNNAPLSYDDFLGFFPRAANPGNYLTAPAPFLGMAPAVLQVPDTSGSRLADTFLVSKDIEIYCIDTAYEPVHAKIGTVAMWIGLDTDPSRGFTHGYPGLPPGDPRNHPKHIGALVHLTFTTSSQENLDRCCCTKSGTIARGAEVGWIQYYRRGRHAPHFLIDDGAPPLLGGGTATLPPHWMTPFGDHQMVDGPGWSACGSWPHPEKGPPFRQFISTLRCRNLDDPSQPEEAKNHKYLGHLRWELEYTGHPDSSLGAALRYDGIWSYDSL
jgi:RHS repeat-associated protein